MNGYDAAQPHSNPDEQAFGEVYPALLPAVTLTACDDARQSRRDIPSRRWIPRSRPRVRLREHDVTGRPRQLVYTLIGVSMLNHVVLSGTRLTVALYAIQLGATAFTVGVLMALYSLCTMLFAVTVGRLVDRTAARKPMLIASAVLALATLVLWLRPGMPALYVSSLLIGGSFMVYNVAMQHIVGYIGPPQGRVQNYRLAAIGYSVSGVIGPMLAGYGIEWIGHGFTFLFLAALPLVPTVLLGGSRLMLPRPHAESAPPVKRRNLADLLRNREMRNVLLGGGLLDMAWDLFAFAIPVHGSQIGLPPSTIGLILGAFSAATFVMRALLPLTVRWLSAWPQMIVSIFATGAIFALLALVESASLLVALGFALGLSLGGIQPLVMSLLHDLAPPGRVGEAMGIRAAINGMNQTGMPLLFGGIGAALGIVPIFWATAVLFMAAGVVARRHRRR